MTFPEAFAAIERGELGPAEARAAFGEILAGAWTGVQIGAFAAALRLRGETAEAIVAAGISRVVSALEDPDERVAGRGHGILRSAGISVTTDFCADEARRALLDRLTVEPVRPAYSPVVLAGLVRAAEFVLLIATGAL